MVHQIALENQMKEKQNIFFKIRILKVKMEGIVCVCSAGGFKLPMTAKMKEGAMVWRQGGSVAKET